MLVYTRQYCAPLREQFEESFFLLSTRTNAELDRWIQQTKDSLDALKTSFAPTRPAEYFIEMYRHSSASPATLGLIHKWHLCALFRQFEAVYPSIADLPEHCRLSLDVHGTYLPGNPGEIRIIEAAIFEDMCAHVNHGLQLVERAEMGTANKVEIKGLAAFRRAAVTSAFYLVEAYLNSIAFDHVVRNEGSLSVAELDKLTEWDSRSARGKLVSFRDKLLMYPRIILGAPSPIFQENNCEEVSFLLTEAKHFRDAIVHANPRPGRDSFDFEKEARFWQIGEATQFWYYRGSDVAGLQPSDSTLWLQIVDNAISLIRKVEAKIHPGSRRLFWLESRTGSGPFRESVFD